MEITVASIWDNVTPIMGFKGLCMHRLQLYCHQVKSCSKSTFQPKPTHGYVIPSPEYYFLLLFNIPILVYYKNILV